MRQLTFYGFAKRYVSQLSATGKGGIYPLAREAAEANPRLREPLFLYAAAGGNTDVLLRASRGTKLHSDYASLLEKMNEGQVLNALESGSEELPEAYHKVWRSYQTAAHRQERDDRVKELLRQKILKLQTEKQVSTYRIAKDLNLNNANLNAWLKNGVPAKMGLASAREISAYLEAGSQLITKEMIECNM